MRGARCDRSGRKSGEGSAAPGPKSPRWSAERRASLAEGRKAPHKRLACRVKARRPGASHERPYVSRCSAHPSFRVSEAKSKTRAQKRAAGTKRCCLKLRLSVGHSGRGAIAARAGIHNHWPWVWIPGSRALPAPRNDAQKTRRGNEIGCLIPSQASVRGLGCASIREPFEARRPLA